jgi:predicted glycosyltransferase
MLGIAGPLAERRPEATILLLTGSLAAHAYDLPDNLDYVKLPAMPKRALYEGLPARRSRSNRFKNVVYFREAVARATVDAFAPDLIVVDHAPAGLFGELAAALATLGAARPRPAIVFLMRDITFGPDQTRKLWGEEGAFSLLDRLYDRILVYGSRELFDPIAEYGLSPVAAAKTRFVGYLRPPAPARTRAEVRAALGIADRPLAVVTPGGGADGGPLLRAYLAALQAGPDLDLASYVVTGPLLPEAERAELAALAATLPDVTIVPFDADLVGAIHAADLIVSMAGYNAVCETIHAAKRGIVVPREPGPEEQVIRAERFARRGLIDVVPPEELSPTRLLRAIREALVSSPGAPPPLPFDGRERIVDELIAAIGGDPAGDAAG